MIVSEVEGGLRVEALKIAEWIGDKVISVETFHEKARAGLSSASALYERGSLSHGHSGVAMLMHALLKATGDEKYRRAAFEHLKAAVQAGFTDYSLHNGSAGLLLAAEYCSDGMHYAQLRESLTLPLAQECERIAAANADPRSCLDIDVIGGIAGKMLALGDRVPTRAGAYLAATHMSDSRWALPMLGDPQSGPVHNLGMSHGITGALATLALSFPEGEFDREIDELARYLCDAAFREGTAMSWGWSAEQGRSDYVIAHWCYGTPSAALTLASVGARSKEQRLIDEAICSAEMVAAIPLDELHFRDFQLCHGFVGLALVLRQFGPLASEKIRKRCLDLVAHAIRSFDVRAEIGYRLFIADQYLDCYGFLMGSVGIALALLTIAADVDDAWVRCLGLPTTGWLESRLADWYKVDRSSR